MSACFAVHRTEDPILQEVERRLREECGIPARALLIAGVSGGPDSLCLVHALHALGHRPIVAHFDHQLRDESAAEAVHVAEFAAAFGLPFVSGSQDVSEYARLMRISTEEAGRSLRYKFLFAQARTHDAVAVAVGHTADDQVETILMHLLRGAGMLGLTGIAHRVVLAEFDVSIPVVRPLLGAWRQQTLDYCRVHNLPALYDVSNESREFLRNRVRLDLIPTLEAYNPQIRKALWRLTKTAAGDLALIEDLITEAWNRTWIGQGHAYVGFDSARLAAQPPAVCRRLVMRAAMLLQPASELGFEDLERAERFISGQSSRRLELGEGVMLFREMQTIYVTLGEKLLPSEQWPQMARASIPVDPRGGVMVPLAPGWQFTVELAAEVPRPAIAPSGDDRYRGLLDADTLPLALQLRVPRAGDRIQPFGLKGHTQKLSDVFINIGIPERLRPHWPVLASGDQLVWVPGFRIAEPFRVRETTRRAALVAVHPSD